MQEAKKQLNDLIRHASDIDDKLDQIIVGQRKNLQKHKKEYKEMLFKILYDLNLNKQRAEEMESQKNVYKNISEKTIEILVSTKEDFKDYEKIKTIAIVHRNLKKANDLAVKLKTLDSEIKEYTKNRDTSESSGFEQFLSTDIVKMHDKVYEFEEFKYELMFYAKDIDRESFLIVQRKINQIDKILSDFMVNMLKISTSFLQSFRDNRIQESVELVVIREEKRDEITHTVQKQIPDDDLVGKELMSINFTYLGRKENNYKNKFEKGMRDCIKERMKIMVGTDINELDVLFDEFTYIKDFMYVVDGKKSIFDWMSVVQTFHDEIRRYFEEKTIGSKDILFMLNFVEKYCRFLESEMKIHPELLGEDVLSGKESAYIAEYVKTASYSLNTWIKTIENKEVTRFHERISTPMFDEDNRYISENFITFLSLIKQQLEPIAFNTKIFGQITAEIVKLSKSFVKEISKAMEKDFLPACKQKDNPGYEEYVITIGNSGLKITEYISSVPQAQSNEIKDLGNIFLNLAKKANNFLSLFVLNTCKPVLDNVFTDAWYNEDILNVLIITIEDFFSDYKLVMIDFLFYLFIDEMVSELTKAYLKQLTRKRAKVYEDCGYKLESDIKRYTDLFKKYNEDASFDILQKIVPLLSKCNLEIFEIELKALLIAYPDIKRDYVKNIVLKKDHLSDNERKTFLLKTKECFGDLKSERKTLFSSILF